MATKRESTGSSSMLESLMNCSICLEIFTDPKVLPCQHTFCSNCLESWYESHCKSRQMFNVSGQFPCPTCRSTTFLPRGGIAKLPSDFKLGQMQDLLGRMTIRRTTKNTEDCEICKYSQKSVQASHYCTQCAKYICQSCVDHHAASAALSGHQIVSRNAEHITATRCTEHYEDVRYFCSQCEECICTVCLNLKHSDHKVLALNEAYEALRSSLQRHLEPLKQNIKRFIQRHDLTSLEDNINARYQGTKSDIQKHTQSLVVRLQQSERALITALDEKYESSRQALDSSTKKFDELNALCQEAEGLLKPSQRSMLLSKHSKMKHQLEESAQEQCEEILDSFKTITKFEPKDDFSIGQLYDEIPARQADYWQLNLQDPEPIVIEETEEVFVDPDTSEVFDFSMSRRTSILRSAEFMWQWGGFKGARDAAFLPDNSLLITQIKNGPRFLQKYDLDTGGIVATVSQVNKAPYGITYIEAHALIATTDYFNGQVLIFDCDLVQQTTDTNLFIKPSVIASLSTGLYVVCQSSFKTKATVHYPDGRLHRQLNVSRDDAFKSSLWVTVDHHDNIIILDSQCKSLKIFTQEGNMINKAELSDMENMGQFKGVAVDSANNVVLGSESGQIALFTQGGQFIRDIVKLPEGHADIHGLKISESNMMVVVTDNTVYSYMIH